MRILRRTVLIVLASALCLVQLSWVASANGGEQARIVPAHFADGLTGRQLATQLLTRVYVTPTTVPPPGCTYYGASGQILLDGRSQPVCTVNYGEPVVALFFAACDPIEARPFHGATAQQQRHCAKAWPRKHFTAFRLSVDGGPVVNLLQPRFRYVTPQVSVRLPVHNIFDVPPQRTTFVGAGYEAFVQDLSCGRHTITDVRGFDGGTPEGNTFVFRVVNCS